MAKIETLRSDGTLPGAITHINGMLARDEIDKMIVIIVPKDGSIPTMAFCQTNSPAEELGLLELAKVQALMTRNIID